MCLLQEVPLLHMHDTCTCTCIYMIVQCTIYILCGTCMQYMVQASCSLLFIRSLLAVSGHDSHLITPINIHTLLSVHNTCIYVLHVYLCCILCIILLLYHSIIHVECTCRCRGIDVTVSYRNFWGGEKTT